MSAMFVSSELGEFINNIARKAFLVEFSTHSQEDQKLLLEKLKSHEERIVQGFALVLAGHQPKIPVHGVESPNGANDLCCIQDMFLPDHAPVPSKSYR